MAEELKKYGLFVDDLYILRVLEPQVAKETENLTENNEVFLESEIDEFLMKFGIWTDIFLTFLFLNSLNLFNKFLPLSRSHRISEKCPRNYSLTGKFCQASGPGENEGH